MPLLILLMFDIAAAFSLRHADAMPRQRGAMQDC